MKRFMSKKLLVVGVAVAVALGVGGAAFAYFTTSGSGNGSAQVATPSSLTITQVGTPAYNSTRVLSNYVFSQPFNGTQIHQLGNEVTLSHTGSLTSAVVDMVNFGSTAFITPITLNIYSPSNLTTPLTSDMENIAVPNCPSTDPAVHCTGSSHAVFHVTFNNFSPAVVLPSTVVYGMKLDNLVVNDLTPLGSLNVALSTESTDVSVGFDAAPGTLFVDEAQYTAPSNAEITCQTLTTGFNQYSTAAGATCGMGNTYNIPAVELYVSGTGDLYPGGPPQPIDFSVYNPGTIPDALTAVSIAVATDPGNGLVEAVPGETWTDVAGCAASWFTINQAPAINGSVAAGQTWIDAPSGASIVMPTDNSDNQDGCEGATIGLTFTAS